MIPTLNRRALLTLLAAVVTQPVLAGAPDRSIRPKARSGNTLPMAARQAPPIRPSDAQVIDAAGLSGVVSVALCDAETGARVFDYASTEPLPPASVTKALTALYALDALGPGHRFETRLLAGGPVIDGVLEGDLILAGGGDPTLLTDDLATMAVALGEAGVTAITGRFGVWGGALPYLDEIDPPQLDHLGYNPAVSGLNLNFNRVHFEWKRAGGDWAVTMDARSERFRPDVTMARMRIADRAVPVYTYADGGATDDWTVARGALGNGGARWLPVRKPALYAGDVFRSLARAEGIALPHPVPADDARGEPLVAHRSVPLRIVLQDMLKFSTNLTAEAVGLTASLARRSTISGHDASARMMTGWLNQTLGTAMGLADHSGLSDASRVTAGDLVRLLSAPGVRRQLRPILKDIPFRDADGRPIEGGAVEVRAKTGTLNFVTTLAGYVRTATGRDLAFAILAADLDRREAAKAAGDEVPAGTASYNARARDLQQALLTRWGMVT